MVTAPSCISRERRCSPAVSSKRKGLSVQPALSLTPASSSTRWAEGVVAISLP